MIARNHTRRWGRLLLGAFASLGALGIAGCADIEPSGGSGDGDGFISDAPNGGGDKNGGGEDASGGAGGSTETGSGGDSAERAIVEADVIQVSGQRLFALSQYGGLSVIDMTDPAHLSIAGRHKVQGVPFEMYLQGDVVYAMFSSFGRWECDVDYESCNYITSSHIEALDVSDPANIVNIGTFDMPGEISDSRIVGDVLYAVSYENGYCWNCQDAPQTVVTSINVADPESIAVVDRVSFASDDIYGYGWWRRSVSVTPERMYVAGIEWDGNGEGHSTIQIVDIADPTGLLHVGAEVQAHGQIESRWQMDEKDGVLRVVSQPGIWWAEGVPEVQTFQVASSDSISPLGSMPLSLPMPERLRSARFDGDRLYAITAEQVDPLFTIDVSNPAAPQQLGEVELPGWIYYLEPRQDRLFALGFDNSNAEGSMNVSLFDVADLANPSLIQRVNFGGNWSWAPEDQDRIHKAFKINNELGTVFVPYGAYSWEENGNYYGCAHIESGVQMVDFTHDSLTKRGAAPLHGFARRALVHDGNLFTVSDSEVAAYNIADRDAPARIDDIGLSAWVNQSARIGDHIVRVSSDWWTEAARLDVVPASDPGRVEPLGKLDLAAIVGEDDASDCYGWGYFWGAQLFKLDNHRAVLTWSTYPYYGYDESGNGVESGNKTYVVVVNLANPAAPVVEGKLSMPFSTSDWYRWGSLDGGKSVVLVGNQLAFRRVDGYGYYYGDSTDIEHAWIETVDLSDPSAPVHSGTLALPDGFGHSLLVKHGAQVMTSHWEPVPDMEGKVRFYIDRATFVGGSLVASAPVNVPGALVSFDPASNHALTVDFQQMSVPAQDAEDCYQTYGWNAWYEETAGMISCHFMQQTLKLISLGGAQVSVLDTEPLDVRYYTYNTQVTDSRVFSQGWSYTSDGYGSYTIFTIGDIGGDTIHTANKVLPAQGYLWAAAAEGDHLILASYDQPGIHVLDATDLDQMSIEKKADVTAWVYSVALDGDRALCSMGPFGLEAVNLQ